MIITQCVGGLGNQMFQYAYGKACSLDAGEPLFLDTSWYRSRKRKFLLEEFNVSYDGSSGNRAKLRFMKFMQRPKVVRDSGHFEAQSMPKAKNLLLEGHWESWRYFEKIQDLIKREFVLKNPSEAFIAAISQISGDAISVHVRRGDYLVPHGKALNGKEYCEKAVAHVIQAKKLADPKITIFSDDPVWCRKELATLAGHATIIFDGKLASDAEEMMLMSRYAHNVMGNSTFSWWAAFLNQNPGKIVVMPEQWYTEPGRNALCLENLSIPGWVVLA